MQGLSYFLRAAGDDGITHDQTPFDWTGIRIMLAELRGCALFRQYE
jgi:hypothetical protein